ncbi:MAG TPA: hypothetical protein DD713_03965 [Nitrospiraceae bacterium]|nr:hypothetical protein [Nitrospiraceae bacterium]
MDQTRIYLSNEYGLSLTISLPQENLSYDIENSYKAQQREKGKQIDFIYKGFNPALIIPPLPY